MSNSHSGTIGRTRGLSMSGQVRRQRSIEWQKERRYSSSDDDTGGPLRNNAPSIDSSILASIIKQTQQLTNADRSYRSDCDTEDNNAAAMTAACAATNPSLTNRSPMHMRQASPFPLESTNRRLHYAAKAEERIRNGDSIFTAGKPALLANNTLIRTSRGLTNRRGGNLTSSSSTISSVSNNNNDRDKECKELIKDKEREIYDNPHNRFISDGDDEPPPEPAPPEVPPRGPSMQTTLKKRPDFVLTIDKNGDQKHEEYIPSSNQQDFLIGGSSGSYPTRSSPMANGISNQRFCEMKMWGAQIESLKQISCSFVGKAAEGLKNVALKNATSVFSGLKSTFG